VPSGEESPRAQPLGRVFHYDSANPGYREVPDRIGLTVQKRRDPASLGAQKAGGWINGWIAHGQSSHFRTENTPDWKSLFHEPTRSMFDIILKTT
jgi:hypothetical protein